GEGHSLAPADLNSLGTNIEIRGPRAPAGPIVERLGGVEVAVPELLLLFLNWLELLAVKIAEQILPIGPIEHPLRIWVIDGKLIQIQFEQIRAFVKALDAAGEGPGFQIG